MRSAFLKNLLKKLQTEEKKGKSILIKTYLSFDNQNLIVQVLAQNRTIEKSYPNSKIGKKKLKQFVSQFKTARDIDIYLFKK
jgi:hypothetical protein